MNLKLKRLVRTPSSEQYALFDLDQLDGAARPSTIGKLDLHFTAEGMYGTLLIWDEGIRNLPSADRCNFVRAVLADLAQPMGVPNEYVVEFFAPALELYEVIHNVGLEGEDEEDEADEIAEDEDAGTDTWGVESLDAALASDQESLDDEVDDMMIDDDMDAEEVDSLMEVEYEDESVDTE